MIKYRIIYTLIALSLALFYIYCDSYVPLLIIVVFLSLTVLSVISAAASARLVTVDTTASHSVVTKGEKTEAQFGIRLTNKSILPISAVLLRVEFDDMQERSGTKRRLGTTLCAKETRTVYTMVSTKHCAYIRCRVCDVYICDAFGLTRHRVKKGHFTAHMTIMPLMAERSVIEQLPAVNTDDSDRYSDYKTGSDPSQVLEVREYADGDDMRRIHWGLSSKYDELMVKEFSQPISDSCVVVIETGIADDTPDNRKSVSDRLMSVFTKLSDELIRNEQMFSVYWYSKQGGKCVCFDVVMYDDVFPVAEGFLSMEFSDDIGESLINTAPYIEGNNKRVYYIFSSGSFNKDLTNHLSDKYIPIDADKIFDNGIKSEIGELFETKR